jgi:hypothetical protein
MNSRFNNHIGRGNPSFIGQPESTQADTGSHHFGGQPGHTHIQSNNKDQASDVRVNNHRLTKKNIKRLQRQFTACPAINEVIDEVERSDAGKSSADSSSIDEVNVCYAAYYEIEKGSYENPLKNLIEHRNRAISMMAYIDVDVYLANIHNIVEINDDIEECFPLTPLVGDVYAVRVSQELLAMAATDDQFDLAKWANENQGKSLNELHKSLVNKVKEDRSKRREPKPIPVEEKAKLRCVNDLRRYLYENSARERVWTRAGTEAIPGEVLDRNIVDVLRWVKAWKDNVWDNKVQKDEYGLQKCPDCGMCDKKGEPHHCFILKSKQVQYKGGIPLRKQVQVATRGDKVYTVTKKQMDLQQALVNYNRTKDNLAVRPNEELKDMLRTVMREGQEGSGDNDEHMGSGDNRGNLGRGTVAEPYLRALGVGGSGNEMPVNVSQVTLVNEGKATDMCSVNQANKHLDEWRELQKTHEKPLVRLSKKDHQLRLIK